jgi:hypothetical protein
MEIIKLPQENALVRLSSSDLLIFMRALAHVRENMPREQYVDIFEMSPKYGLDRSSLTDFTQG